MTQDAASGIETVESVGLAECEWTPWFEPRPIGDGFEFPLHHELVEIRIPGADETRAIRPVDLPADTDPARLEWRPMPWATEGGGRLRTLRELNDPGAVFAGEDGRLFHRIGFACEQIFDGLGLTDEGCRHWVEQLERRREWCAARGIEYRMLIIPEHHTLYPDKVLGHPAPSPDRPIMRLLRGATGRTRDCIIYPVETMLAGRQTHEVSYPHDVHFTRYGSFLCYHEIMRTLPALTPERVVHGGDLARKTMLVAGGLARAFGQPGRTMEWFDPPRIKSKTIFKSNTMTDDQVNIFVTEEPDLPRLVIFRSSNSGQLFPFLLRHFSRLTAVSGMRMYYDLLESEAPQVVITEIPERYIAGRSPRTKEDRDLCNLADDALSGFEQDFGHKLPLPGAPGT